MEDRSRTQVYYGRLLRVNLHRFRTEPRDYLALIRDIIKTFERVLFGPVIRGSWPNYYIKCWNTAVTTLAIKRAPAKLAERFGAYNGHPYPFMLLPPTFHRRGRPYNTRAFQFTKTKKERKKEREERGKRSRRDIAPHLSIAFVPSLLQRSSRTPQYLCLSRFYRRKKRKRKKENVRESSINIGVA